MARPDDILDGLGKKSLVPRLRADAPLSKLKLGPGEGYVLSRIDGRTTLWEICLMVPLGRDETQRILRKMRLGGVVEIPGTTEPMPAPEPERPERPEPRPAPSVTSAPAKTPPRSVATGPSDQTPPPARLTPSPQSQRAATPSRPPDASISAGLLESLQGQPILAETTPSSPVRHSISSSVPSVHTSRTSALPAADTYPVRADEDVADVEVILRSEHSPMMLDDTRPQARESPRDLTETGRTPARSPVRSLVDPSLRSPASSRFSPVRRLATPLAPVLTAAIPPSNPDAGDAAADSAATDAAAMRSDYRPIPRAPLVQPDAPADLSAEQRQRIDTYYAMINEADAFTLLGISQHDDKRELQRAYFRLSKEFHPDRYFKKDIGAYRQRVAAIFQAITEARDVLQDDGRRAAYLAGEPPT